MRWFWLVVYALFRPQPKPDVSRDWMVDSERRQWREGIDGPCWRWPVEK